MDDNTALILCAVQKLRDPISKKRTWKLFNIEVLNITLTFPLLSSLTYDSTMKIQDYFVPDN